MTATRSTFSAADNARIQAERDASAERKAHREASCDCLGTRPGALGEVVRENVTAVYRYRICRACGRIQGIARIPR